MIPEKETATTFHDKADGGHCFKCGKALAQEGQYGIIGLSYTETDEPVISCMGHKEDLKALAREIGWQH